jgi:Uncharacterized conserved protein, contains double-stranded beta-helix domain
MLLHSTGVNCIVTGSRSPTVRTLKRLEPLVDTAMDTFTIRDVADELATTGAESTEAFRTDNVSLEVMRFEPGDEDSMHAHGEDEIYVVESGTAELNVEGDVTPVSAGDVVHLDPGTDHRFQAFEDELVMTVVYAPATGVHD